MKKRVTHWMQFSVMAASLFTLSFLSSCKDDDDPAVMDKPVKAIFSYSADGNTITFVNASVNAVEFSWDFGDGETSAEKDPVYTYDEVGTYQVKLKASNASSEEVYTLEVITENAGPLARVIVGKKWIPVRGEAIAVAMGPQGDFDYTSSAGLWFTWGDQTGSHAQLAHRASLANDEYTFLADGTYTVDFHGDFWGEYGIWGGIEGVNESDIAIVDGKLPLNKDNVDVSAFVKGTWEWEIDETNKTLAVKGAGAHIFNPRYKNTQTSYAPGTGITYNVVKAVEGTEADTLIIYIQTHDNDFGSDPRQYHILASYHGTPPALKELPEPVPPQFETAVPAETVSHTFLAEDGVGSGVASVDTPYDADFTANIGGSACTKLTKDNTEADRYANYLLFAGSAANESRAEMDFSGGKTKVSVDVYMPSSNNFSGDFKNLVRIRFIDQSQYGNFWEHYIQLEKSNIATDEWVTLTFDFTDLLAAAAAGDPASSPDGVMLEFGEINHIAGGSIYVKNFKLINP